MRFLPMPDQVSCYFCLSFNRKLDSITRNLKNRYNIVATWTYLLKHSGSSHFSIQCFGYL